MAYKAPVWEDGKSPAISAENLNALSQAAEGAQVLYGNSAPTSSTKGAVGQFYLVVVADSDGNYPLYQCVAIANGSYTWQNVFAISTSLASSLALSTPATIRGAIARLALSPAGTGTLYVHCKDEAGEPVSGCVVQIGGEFAVTNASGTAKYLLAPGSHSIAICSPIDYGAEAQTTSVTIATCEIMAIEVIIQDSMHGATELDITSAKTVAFSNRVASADVFAVGGGGSGGVAHRVDDDDMMGCASGGAGGKTATALRIDIKDIFSCVVGSGGAAVADTAANGKAGGTTTVSGLSIGTVVSAAGGAGGSHSEGYIAYKVTGASGGSGSAAVNIASNYAISADPAGEDGSNGGSQQNGTIAGGTGQGRTTRAFGESDGELFASAGASCGQYYSSPRVVGTPGEGGGTAFSKYYGSSDAMPEGTSISAGSAITRGSGGGAMVCLIYNSYKPSKYSCKSGAGAPGLVRFRWRVAA